VAPTPTPIPEAQGDQEVALELRQEPMFDLLLALPPGAEDLSSPLPDTRLFTDPDTGLLLSLERRGDGDLHPAPSLDKVALRAAKRQGAAGEVEVIPTRMGDVEAIQVDFRAAEARTSTCVAWRNGSLYLLGVSDPSGGEGVSELSRLLCAAVEFTSLEQPLPVESDPLAALDVSIPAARGLAVSVREDGATITDVAEGFVTVLAGFAVLESPYRGLEGMALGGRLESEGCTVVGSGPARIARRPARRARCVLGVGGPRPEFALLHVVLGDRSEWVVSVVSADEDWGAAEAYAARLLDDASLP
jgi:hypothetical protein